MLRKESRFDQYAYRVANFPLDESVKNIEEGQFVTLKDRKVVLATTGFKKAFLVIGSNRTGRDQVSGRAVRNISFLVGPFAGMKTSNYDADKSYSDMTPLTVVDGKLTPVTASETVVAYSVSAPVSGYLEIISA